jgi:hypothetical protein
MMPIGMSRCGFFVHGQDWMATVISAGAVAGLTTVVLTLLIGATRIIFAMGADVHHLLQDADGREPGDDGDHQGHDDRDEPRRAPRRVHLGSPPGRWPVSRRSC